MCDFTNYKKLNRFYDNKINFIKERGYKEESSIKKYLYVILNENIALAEKNKDKDLYDFSTSEIIDLINNTFITVKTGVKNQNFNIIKTYIDWAIERGLLVTGINPCDSITDNDFKISEKMAKNYYQTLDEFYDWLKELKCSNVDKALITLVRYGVEIKETVKLQFKDINKEEKTIVIRNNNDVKFLPIDDRFIEVMEKSKYCSEYDKTSYVQDSNYIVKQTRKGRSERPEINSIRNRFNIISVSNGIARINPTMLKDNREYDLLLEIAEQNGQLITKDFKDIIQIFNYKNITESSIVNKSQIQKRQFVDFFPQIKVLKNR